MHVVHIDEHVLLPTTSSASSTSVDAVRATLPMDTMHELGCKLHVVPLTAVLNDAASAATADDDDHDNDGLVDLFKHCRTLDAKEDLVYHLRQRLLHRLARQLQCDVVLTGECMTRLAIRAIGFVSKGRGFALAGDVGLECAMDGGDVIVDGAHERVNISLMRLLRDVGETEVRTYARLRELPFVQLPTLGDNTARTASMNRLAEGRPKMSCSPLIVYLLSAWNH